MLFRIFLVIILSIILVSKIVSFNNMDILKGINIVLVFLVFILVGKIYLNKFLDKNEMTNNIQVLESNINYIDNDINVNYLLIEELKDYPNKYEKLDSELVLLKENSSELDKSIEEKVNLLSAKTDEYNKLSNEVNSLYQIRRVIDNFPTVNQFPRYPNGCEVASLYLILKYYGVNVSLEELSSNLEKGSAPNTVNGRLMAADPEEAYVGNPKLTNGGGYGVYQKPIIRLANKYKAGMIDMTGSSLSRVLKKVGENKPVQVWASVNMKNTSVCISWYTNSGKRIDWMCGLHSLVIIGFTYDKVITSDPYTGTIKYYNRNQFEKMFNQYGRRAIYYE